MPSEDERAEIFRIHIRKRGRTPEKFDLRALVAASKDFSGAEIEEGVISGLYEAFYEGADLTTQHILTALQQTVPLSKTMEEKINQLRSWAEGRARNASVPLDVTRLSQKRRTKKQLRLRFA